jgi:serine/threonine protein kinase
MLVGYPPFIADTTMGIYQKILAGRISFPSRPISGQAKLLIRNLLTADLTKRYGNLIGGVEDIKSSDWFCSTDWEALGKFEIPAPYIPNLKSDTQDTSNFEAYPDSKEESESEESNVPNDLFRDW